jgi:hypothetical protein
LSDLPKIDATGKIVNLAQDGNYDKVVIIIMADGQENASRSYQSIKPRPFLIDVEPRIGKWFFLGPILIMPLKLPAYGNIAASTVRSSKANLGLSMSLAAQKRSSYSASGAEMTYNDEEKDALKKD